MTKSLIKNTFREIKNSKARFISIMAIIALGVGFLSGIKATAPSMYNMAENYYADHNLMDFRLVSTVGFDEDDISAVSELDGVTSVMPSYYADLIEDDAAGGSVVRVIALPTAYEDNEVLNTLKLIEGRLPENKGEILAEHGGLVSGGYKIGDTVTFSVSAGDSRAQDMVDALEYTIVGTVESPLYISYQRGNTSIGSGEISAFMYILPDDFAFERYTELYVKTVNSEGGISAFSDEYSENTEAFAEVLKGTADLRVQAFNTDVIDKAKDDLDSANEEYAEQKADALGKLDDARAEIEDAQLELDETTAQAQSQLDSALAEIENARAQLLGATDEYNRGIEGAESEILSGEAELAAGWEDYNSSKEEYEAKTGAAQTELENGWGEYNAAYDEYISTQKPALLDGISQAEQSVLYLNSLISSATADESAAQQLAAAQTTLAQLSAQLSAAENEFSQKKAELSAAQAEFDSQKAEGEAQLSAALAQLESAQETLDLAKSQLEEKKAEGKEQLSAAQAEIDSAQRQYDSGVSQLAEQKEEGQLKIDEAWEEYYNSVDEADREFADAEREIEDAQEELDGMSEPQWYVFDRDDNPGYSTFSQNADRLDAVASVFPVFFLLVAILVCVTTMSRLIEEKRTEIGTLKALGYSNFSITMKFVIYASLAGVIGCVAGIFIGVNSLPYIIYNAYKIMYYMEDITLTVNTPSIVTAFLAAIACTVCVSIFVCLNSLKSKPATIIRPKAPKAGKRILLERITPIWSRMGFSSKLTARNLFRYKSRLFMTVIGVAGCTALIVAAFGLKNSFVPLTGTQFDEIFKYNTVVVPKESGNAEELEYLTEILDKNGNVDKSMLMYQEEIEVSCNGVVKDEKTYINVMENPDEFGEIISLRTRKGKESLTLDDSTVMINEKMAEELSVKTGDVVKLVLDGKTAEVKVGGIYEQYISNYVYMTPEMYENLFGEEVKFNLADIALSDESESARSEFGKTLLNDDRIAAVKFVTQSIDEFRNMLDSLNLVVLVMIVCAAALAFVVLYNLSNINIAERVREIATFKVLGFYHRETSRVIEKENIVLTVLGIAVGLVLGVFLTSFIVQTVEVDNIMFGRDIFFTSYIYAAGLTLLFTLIVNFVMSFKLKAVNMVESLKSVE